MNLPIRTLASLTAGLTPEQKVSLDEVASLMLEIYQTLARMRYLSPSDIQQGPHDLPPSILSLYVSLNLDPRIIYLYSALPYIDPNCPRELDFFDRGEFTDFRTERDVVQGRDPMYSDQPEERMRPWMTPLSSIGNHNTALFYDAKKHEVGIFGQMSGCSLDKNLREGWVSKLRNEAGTVRYVKWYDEEEVPITKEEYLRVRGLDQDSDDGDGDEGKEDEGGCDEGGEGDEGADDHGQNDEGEDDEAEEDEEEYDEEDEDDDYPEDENHWDDMDGRPAPAVLRDIVRWYRELKELPGGEKSGWEWDEEITKPLYIKHGWPGENFDGDAFVADQKREAAAKRERERS